MPTPTAYLDVEDLSESQKIRFRSAFGLANVVRNAREFGIVPSASPPSGNNTAALINAAYQRAFDEGFSLAFDFEPGKYYWLESPLLCFAVDDATNTFIRQDCPALIGNTGFQSNVGRQAVQFIATHNLPIVITQGSNGFTINNIWIRTLSNFAASGYGSATTAQRFNDHTLWNNSNLRHNRWSPSCCVAVDPFGSMVPAEDRYPGLEAYYTVTDSFSSNIIFNRCVFTTNRVGVLLGAGVTQNTDGITMRDCNFVRLKYGCVTCHFQTQNCLLDRCIFTELWAAVGNSVHGGLGGRWPGIVNPGNSGYIANVYGGEGLSDGLIHPDWQATFEGGNTNWENIGRIIYTSGPGATRSGVSIRNAAFQLEVTGNPHIKTGRMCKFENVDFTLGSDGSQKIWIENQCPDDLPSNWESGFCGNVNGAETQFHNCNFYNGGVGQETPLDVISFGNLTTGKKNWFKFTNCKAIVVINDEYGIAMLNCRGGAVT